MKLAKISNKNNKLGDIPSVSLTPIESCGNSSKCAKKCYAMRSYKRYPTVRQAWDYNLRLANKHTNDYFDSIGDFVESTRPRFFRWHVSGDILSLKYLNEMIIIAVVDPNTKFLCFTKMYAIVNEHLSKGLKLPSNLSIVLSVWPELEFTNPHSLPLAFCQDGEKEQRYLAYSHIECPGYCETCGMCFELNKLKENVLFFLH